MKTFIKLFVVAFAILGTAACTSETPEIKSPCVGIEGSPCVRRSPTLNQA